MRTQSEAQRSTKINEDNNESITMEKMSLLRLACWQSWGVLF